MKKYDEVRDEMLKNPKVKKEYIEEQDKITKTKKEVKENV